MKRKSCSKTPCKPVFFCEPPINCQFIKGAKKPFNKCLLFGALAFSAMSKKKHENFSPIIKGDIMQIYVVKQGDSIYSIAQAFGVDMNTIISDNQLTNPDSLTIGQTLVILMPERQYIVQQGDSMYLIARKYSLPLEALLEANPTITPPYTIFPGQNITIPATPKLGTFEVNGFTFPFITDEVLEETLPKLTYLSIFSYEVSADGSLTPITDEPLIQKTVNFGVAPLMVITNLDEEGGFSGVITESVLNNPQIQETLINNIIQTMKQKGYYGIVVDFEYILQADKDAFTQFLTNLNVRLKENNYPLFVAVAPKVSGDQRGLLYEAHDYPAIGAVADRVILMTYEWRYTFGDPQPVAPINKVEEVVRYAVSVIPPEKILMGVPNYGYEWMLPYQPSTAARVIGNVAAVNLAIEVGSFIEFDEVSQTPFFTYYQNGRQRIVHFDDARSIDAKLRLANRYNLAGISYWTVNRLFPQAFLVQNALFDTVNIF